MNWWVSGIGTRDSLYVMNVQEQHHSPVVDLGDGFLHSEIVGVGSREEATSLLMDTIRLNPDNTYTTLTNLDPYDPSEG